MDLGKLTNNPEELKTIIFTQDLLISEGREDVKNLQKNINELKSHVNNLKRDNEHLAEQVRFFKSLKFAPKSEKLKSGSVEFQPNLFNEAELVASHAEEESPGEDIEIPAHKRKKNGRGKRKKLPESLPREEVVIDISDDEKICAEDGSGLTCIGEEISEKLKIIPARIAVLRTIRKKYACGKCSGNLKTAKLPPCILPKSIATPSLLAFIVTGKYIDGVPLYRLESVMRRHGIELGRGTMARWMIEVSKRLAPLKQILREELLSSDYIHCDETAVRVLKEKNKSPASNSYMWVQGRSGEKPIVLYDYHHSRGASVPANLLRGFKGYLQVDGYAGYNLIGGERGVERLGCMSHCRRYFFRAWKHSRTKNIGSRGLAFIKKLYAIEDGIKDKSPEERKLVRQGRAAPILEEMKLWLESQSGKHPPKGLAAKAISYALGEWEFLTGYLENGRLNMSNDFIERAIRPFAIGRKNWLFSDTPAGAEASALWYSLIETAKANGREPFEYLLKVFEKIPTAETLEDYLELLPFTP